MSIFASCELKQRCFISSHCGLSRFKHQ